MRVCVETNVFISYLLKPELEGPPLWIIQAALANQFTLILSETTITELRAKVENKPYLSLRIPIAAVTRFVALLRAHATVVTEQTGTVPTVVRDPKDDYLIAHSVIHHVDYLVSGDKDLLVLGSVLDVRIVSPADFVLLLRTLDD
jgi:putative PIN family toxin of toxin-antitoxin system